ncbi:MAG: hypothetical protein ACPL4I_13055, partial [Bacteroidota bacterium]
SRNALTSSSFISSSFELRAISYNIYRSNAAPYATLSINECGAERVQHIELSTNVRATLLLLLCAVARVC